MYLNGLDYAIIITYFVIVLGVGLWISKLARNKSGFSISWEAIKSNGIFWACPNASGMFDISGVMWDGYLIVCLWP